MHDHGITEENVNDVTSRADLILDGVDVTTKPPLRHKVHLHRHAREQRKTVVSGYDIAGVQMLLIYDYGTGEELLAGKVKLDEVEKLEPFEFLARVIPFTVIPIEIIPELERAGARRGRRLPAARLHREPVRRARRARGDGHPRRPSRRESASSSTRTPCSAPPHSGPGSRPGGFGRCCA